MADDEKTEETEVQETPATDAEGAAPIVETDGADAAAEATEASELPAETTPGRAPAAEDAGSGAEDDGGSGDAVTGDDAPAAAPATPAEPEVVKTPKERRAERRAAAVAKRGPRRPSPDEREAARKAKAEQRRRYRAKVKERRAAERAAAPAPEPAQAQEHGPGRAKTRQGVVVSDKADKTIIVRIDVTRRHRRYHKILRSTQTLSAHDERNDANEGDTVRVVETRPMSRTKRWRLVEVVERAR
jgi:small subunit ribosomal protein S17